MSAFDVGGEEDQNMLLLLRVQGHTIQAQGVTQKSCASERSIYFSNTGVNMCVHVCGDVTCSMSADLNTFPPEFGMIFHEGKQMRGPKVL